MNTQNDANGNAMPFDENARFADLAEAQAYLAKHGQSEAYAPIADQGEYIFYRRISADRLAQLEAENGAAPQSAAPEILAAAAAKLDAPKAKPQGKAKGKAKAKAKAKAKGDASKADPAPKALAPIGGRPKAEREKAKAEKAKANPPAKDYGNSWRPLSARKWIGPWADYKAKAEKGQLPDVGSAKLSGEELRQCKFFALNAEGRPIFSADTHRPFEKRLLALCALIRAKDLKGLKAHDIKEISTTPNMLAKLRDLAIAALSFKAEKANGKKAKAEGAAAPAQADAAPADNQQG